VRRQRRHPDGERRDRALLALRNDLSVLVRGGVLELKGAAWLVTAAAP